MSILAGKTVLITGGNRGIGHAIGLRFAKEKANIVILAKDSPSPHATINLHSATESIKAAGGNALAIDADISNNDEIQTSIAKAVAEYGAIDILINNAACFCFADSINTSTEQWDLLFSVNARATFFLSQACFPYLKQATNPHILNISPPLDMNPGWFKHHLAFTMSKYNMSMCTLGMAAEFRPAKIAVNSLWPQTTIATTTIKDHFLPNVYAGSRWPTIMADAAFEIIQRDSKHFTGNFIIDEILLREIGITDFTHYAVDPNSPLAQDLFVPENKDYGNEFSLSQELFKESR
ncbi:MAG: SDR family oxidoreductase [Coxiellaceae bacterium]|nr:MAG: SDR family oxidoreductase [Coxiellaceae bacterium]